MTRARVRGVRVAQRTRLRFRTRDLRRDDSGFGVLEVVVAVTLFVVAAVAAAVAIMGNINSSVATQQKVRAVGLANSALAAIVPGKDVDPALLAKVSLGQPVNQTGDGYAVLMQITPAVAECARGNARTVNVVVLAPSKNSATTLAERHVAARMDSVVAC